VNDRVVAGARTAPWVVAVAIAILAVYAAALDASFQFDDWNVIVDNPRVHGRAAWWASMPGIRPLLKLSYVANWTLAGESLAARAFAMRVTNVAIHAANAGLVLWLARRWLAQWGLDAAHAHRAAVLAALLFALHPAQTEAVTYVSGRSVSLMATAMLLALRAQVRATQAATTVERRGWWLVAALLYVAALAIKEHAWTLPLAAWLVARAAPGAATRDAWRATTALWVVTAAALVAVFATPDYWRLLGHALDTRPLGANLLTQIDGQWYLLVRVALALHTNLDPDLPVHAAWSGRLFAQALVLAIAFGVALAQWRRRRWLAVGAAWCAIHLAATNTVLPRLDVANDRQLYLALAGLAWVVAVPLTARRDGAHDAMRTAVAVLLCVTLAAATVRRNADYATEVTLWTATVRASPGKARAWNNLGWALHTTGRVSDAARAYSRAIALDPEDPRPRINLQLVEDGLPPSVR
jgi:tetratricopeptide (TPR) repeat protein